MSFNGQRSQQSLHLEQGTAPTPQRPTSLMIDDGAYSKRQRSSSAMHHQGMGTLPRQKRSLCNQSMNQNARHSLNTGDIGTHSIHSSSSSNINNFDDEKKSMESSVDLNSRNEPVIVGSVNDRDCSICDAAQLLPEPGSERDRMSQDECDDDDDMFDEDGKYGKSMDDDRM